MAKTIKQPQKKSKQTQKQKQSRKRRIIIGILSVPVLFAVAVLIYFAAESIWPKVVAKDWLRENEPESVLLEADFIRSDINGVKSKTIVATCLDQSTGIIYRQGFEKQDGKWVTETNVQRGLSSMLAGYMGYQHVATLLENAALGVSTLYYPDTQGYSAAGCLVFAPDAAPESLPALWAQITEIVKAEPVVTVRLIAAPKVTCEAILNADAVAYRTKYFDAYLVGSVPEMGELIHKKAERLYSCLFSTAFDLYSRVNAQYAESPEQGIEVIKAEASPDADALWEINSESVSAYRLK